jgi:hypothetical protein
MAARSSASDSVSGTRSTNPDSGLKQGCRIVLRTPRYLFLRCPACNGDGFLRRPCWKTSDANGVERCRVCDGDGSIAVKTGEQK